MTRGKETGALPLVYSNIENRVLPPGRSPSPLRDGVEPEAGMNHSRALWTRIFACLRSILSEYLKQTV